MMASACSAQGGKKAEKGVELPPMKIAMVTHAPAGDTFWDIIKKGGEAAAAKNNVTLEYSSDVDPAKQATLIQNAIDRKVDGIAVTIPNPAALTPAIKKAVDAGIPVVAFNAGFGHWQDSGAMMYFGQDESLAGEAAGRRLTEEGAKKVLCVIQEQGQVQLEARCAGVKKGFTGGTTENINVRGTDLPDVRSTLGAKLRQDKSITHVITLGAPFALVTVQAVKDADSSAKVVTFDTSADLVTALKNGDVQWAIDQQPYLQGYMAVDSLWLYRTNGNSIGGGREVLTGPTFIDKSNIDKVAEYASRGTR
jgi:simple sugar transport system substrate-binding protein